MSRRLPPTAVDWLIAAVMAAFGLTEELSARTSALDHEQSSLWLVTVMVAAALVLVRRHAPFTVLTVYSLASAASFAYFGDLAAAWQFYTQLVLLFTLVSEIPPRDPRTVLGLVVTGLFVGSMMLTVDHPFGPGDMAVAVVMTSIAGGTGFAVWRHRQVAVQAREHGELLAREAVAEERTRIARELHDVVAHSVSVMVMQAGAARLMLRPDQLVERETLALVEEAGREAVEELRRMLGLLRTDSGEDGLAPQPSLARLEDLMEQVRAAGLEVKLTVRGEARPLPAGLELSAYRIIQEALTNTLKHAGPARVAVTVSHLPRTLSLEVVDDGPEDGHIGLQGAGHGLIGMRERVALFHGRLATGPLRGGGYGVSASFPLAVRATGEKPAG
ncbi:sensor histidine kinase [Streptosporangium sp. NPDC006930]|uniref:sensor histidine kinase n=1 Tax=Streptosporangium sp. NPDC006930 TaxID=3154783 RepID=UPI0034475676